MYKKAFFRAVKRKSVTKNFTGLSKILPNAAAEK